MLTWFCVHRAVGPRGPNRRTENHLLLFPGPVALPNRGVPRRAHTSALWASGLVKRQSGLKVALHAARPLLANWDHRAARSAHRYLAVSKVTAARMQRVYGVDAEVVSPPPTLRAGGAEIPVEGIEPGFCLCTTRLLPYKNVGILVEAMQYLSGQRLVVVGDGPIRPFLESTAGPNVKFIGAVSDAQMRWLYRNSVGLVAASHEDYGLTRSKRPRLANPAPCLGAAATWRPW